MFWGRTLRRSRAYLRTILGASVFLFSISAHVVGALAEDLDSMASAAVDQVLLDYADFLDGQNAGESFVLSEQVDPPLPRPGTDIDDLYGEEPVNRPPLPTDPGSFNPGIPPGYGYGGYNPTLSSRQGATYLIGMKSLYQTLNFYGVTHYIERTSLGVEFKIIESKSGYFKNLNRLDVAFALREFSRYLTAHLCNDPSVDNLYKVFSQVSDEEIGLRFKYDMAWALMGNFLPRQPNATYLIGTRWAAFGKLINSSKSLGTNSNEGKELQRWTLLLSDVMGLLQTLNSLMCFVDIRPKPKDEIRKKIVVTKLLDMDRDLNNIYEPLRQLVDDARAMGASSQLEYVRLDSDN